jgi:hypothetical protein
MSMRQSNSMENIVVGVTAFVVLTAILLIVLVTVDFSGPPTSQLSPAPLNPPPSQSVMKPPSEEEIVAEADRAAKEYVNNLMSTPAGRQEVDRLGSILKRAELNDAALRRFQNENAISDRIAEAACKEWVQTHNTNTTGLADFKSDWDLQEVKSICLRDKEHGIPYEYLPENEK